MSVNTSIILLCPLLPRISNDVGAYLGSVATSLCRNKSINDLSMLQLRQFTPNIFYVHHIFGVQCLFNYSHCVFNAKGFGHVAPHHVHLSLELEVGRLFSQDSCPLGLFALLVPSLISHLG